MNNLNYVEIEANEQRFRKQINVTVKFQKY